MNNKLYKEGDIIFIKPKESTNFKLAQGNDNSCKDYSVKGDKYLD